MEHKIRLDGERVIAFTDKTGPKRLILSRITGAEWKAALGKIQVEVENEGQDQIWRVDQDTPLVELVDAKLIRAEGYMLGRKPEEMIDLMDSPEWKKLVPLGAKLKAAQIIRDVAPVPVPIETPFDPALVDVALEAVWGVGEKMMKFSGLVHTFDPPSIKHQARVRRAASESRVVVGGSRTNRTIYGSKAYIYLEIYDELIRSVSGYMVDGLDLTMRENIVAEMDTLHKYKAVEELFAVPDDEPMPEESKQ